jgi:hypothetical protein
MKVKVNKYLFDASAKTVMFLDYGTIDLNRVLLITNVTDNIIIYNFADSTAGGTVSGNVLTLEYDTTSMSDDDKLLIFYQEDDYEIVEDGKKKLPVVDSNIEQILSNVLNELKIMNQYLLIGFQMDKEITEGDL